MSKEFDEFMNSVRKEDEPKTKMSKVIKYTDPFLGEEIELREVRKVFLGAFNDEVTYYVIDTEKYKKRGLDPGIYYKDTDRTIKWLSKEQVEVISRIYDKLTRID